MTIWSIDGRRVLRIGAYGLPRGKTGLLLSGSHMRHQHRQLNDSLFNKPRTPPDFSRLFSPLRHRARRRRRVSMQVTVLAALSIVLLFSLKKYLDFRNAVSGIGYVIAVS